MASQVLSGAANASYTNNTGQNVRLIINYMSNVTSMTWAGVTVTADSTTIGKDIQNITGEFRQAVRGDALPSGNNLYSQWVAKLSSVKATLLRDGARGNYLPSTPGISNTVDVTYEETVFKATPTYQSSSIFQPNLFYVPLTISRGGNFPVELMLANGQSFSAVCGAFNAIAIKEDGT